MAVILDVDKVIMVNKKPDPEHEIWETLHNVVGLGGTLYSATEALQAGTSVVIKVTSAYLNPDGNTYLTEAITTVPNCKVVTDSNGNKTITVYMI